MSRKTKVLLAVAILFCFATVTATQTRKRVRRLPVNVAAETAQTPEATPTPAIAPWKGSDGNPASVEAPTVGRLDVPIDYTTVTTFAFASTHMHSKLRIVDCQFVAHFAVGDSGSVVDQFYGNVVIIAPDSSQVASIRDHEHASWLWIDHNHETLVWLASFVPQLYNSQSIRVTYDPDCGLVTNIQILTFRQQ